MNESLLALVINDEKVNIVLSNLRRSVQEGYKFEISPEDILYVQNKFHQGIATGEKGLHELSFQLLHDFASQHESKASLIVWGRCPDLHHPDIVKSYTRIDLSQVMSSKYMDTMIAWTHSPICKLCKKKTNTIASFNQYKIDAEYASGLKLLLSRIKTTSNICYKIADIVFDIDRMFQRDKVVNRYTQALTDMYGVKMIFSNNENIFTALDYFKNNSDIKILEEKDYLGDLKKKSGYEAYKVIIQKSNQLFEIQFQTTKMLEVERKTLTASHKTYKEKQMEERRLLGDEYQNFYDILIQLFSKSKDSVDYREI